MLTGCSARSSGCTRMEIFPDRELVWPRSNGLFIGTEAACGRKGWSGREQRFSSPSDELVLDRSTWLGCLGGLTGLTCLDDAAGVSGMWLQDGALSCRLMDDELDAGIYRERPCGFGAGCASASLTLVSSSSRVKGLARKGASSLVKPYSTRTSAGWADMYRVRCAGQRSLILEVTCT